MSQHSLPSLWMSLLSLAAVVTLASGAPPPAGADETCNSPYMGNLIKTQEDYVYVWTLGVKGIGEAGTIGATPAVQSAVVDALAHLGVRHIDMPATPLRVWEAIQAARESGESS